MAVERSAQSVEFGRAQQSTAAPNAVGFVNPDVAKFTEADTRNPVAPSTMDNIVGALVGPVMRLAEKELNIGRQEAYLRGQAAAGAGLSREAVESNILTKDWATAGWADTRGRLAQADAEAQTSADMMRLREQSPEDMQKYLAERRKKLMMVTEGMSLQARQGFMAQQLTSDRAAIAKHTTEHQKFIIDQTGKAVSTDMSVRFNSMTQAKTDPVAYNLAADNAFAGLFNNVWSNPRLPEDSRIKLTTEAAASALGQNHQVLYEKMRDVKLPGGYTMLEKLPFDDQVKLAKGYEQSLSDTKAMRLGDYSAQRGLMEATLDDELSPMVSYKDLQAFIDKGVQLNALTPADITSLNRKWADGNLKKQQSSTLASAYAAGDVNTMFSLGKNSEDGYKAFIQMAARNGQDPAKTVGQLLQIGLNTGQQSAFKGVGELTRSGVASLGSTGTIDPGQLSVLNTVLGQLDRAQQDGNGTALSAYLGAFSDEDRQKIMMYREGLQQGKAPAVAAADTARQLDRSSQLSDTDRNVLTAQLQKENGSIVAKLEPRGLWGAIKNSMPNFLRFQENADRDALIPSHGVFENDERVQQALAQSKAAMLEELNYVSRSNPFASADSREKLALAKVNERTLQLRDGPLVLPRMLGGTNVQQYFGVPASVNKDTIADVLSDLHKAAPGNRIVYRATGQGQLQWQEYGPDGQLMNPGGVFDPRTISGAVRDRQSAATERFMRTDGRGTTVKGPDGSSVTYNGNNTVGVPNDIMYDYRANLVKHEDVRGTPYDDASGKVVNGKRVQTVGVGVSSHNPFYPKVGEDGKVSEADINDSFMRASNDAAAKGRNYQRSADVQNAAGFKLMAELSYQGGSVTKDFVEAVRSKEVDKALSALKATPQYKMAHDSRKASYESLLKEALKRS